MSLRAFATQSRSMLYQNSILACFTLFAKTDCLLLLNIRSQNLGTHGHLLEAGLLASVTTATPCRCREMIGARLKNKNGSDFLILNQW